MRIDQEEGGAEDAIRYSSAVSPAPCPCTAMASKRWLHPYLSGPQAEELLMEDGVDGSFLCRPSQTNPGDYTISVRRGDEVVHVKVQSVEGYYDLYGGQKFATLAELVIYHVQNPGTLREKNGQAIELKIPLNREDLASEKWYYDGLSGKEAEMFLQGKGQDGSYLVRNSAHSPGNYVLSVRLDDGPERSDVIHLVIRNRRGRYDIGGGPSFSSIKKLIEHYKTSTGLVDAESERAIELKSPYLQS